MSNSTNSHRIGYFNSNLDLVEHDPDSLESKSCSENIENEKKQNKSQSLEGQCLHAGRSALNDPSSDKKKHASSKNKKKVRFEEFENIKSAAHNKTTASESNIMSLERKSVVNKTTDRNSKHNNESSGAIPKNNKKCSKKSGDINLDTENKKGGNKNKGESKELWSNPNRKGIRKTKQNRKKKNTESCSDRKDDIKKETAANERIDEIKKKSLTIIASHEKEEEDDDDDLIFDNFSSRLWLPCLITMGSSTGAMIKHAIDSHDYKSGDLPLIKIIVGTVTVVIWIILMFCGGFESSRIGRSIDRIQKHQRRREPPL